MPCEHLMLQTNWLLRFWRVYDQGSGRCRVMSNLHQMLMFYPGLPSASNNLGPPHGYPVLKHFSSTVLLVQIAPTCEYAAPRCKRVDMYGPFRLTYIPPSLDLGSKHRLLRATKACDSVKLCQRHRAEVAHADAIQAL